MNLRWFLLGFIAVAVALLAQWPASMTARWINARTALTLGQTSGTVWNGQAAQVSYQGFGLGRVSWSLAPASLFTGSPRAQVLLQSDDLRANSEIRRHFGGGTSARQLQAMLPAEWLQQIINEPGLRLDGLVTVNIDQAVLDADGWLTAIEGNARWQDARLRAPIVAELGEFRIDWRTLSDGEIVGELSDAGGPLGLSGTVNIQNRLYRVHARLLPRGASAELAEALRLLGRPDASGAISLYINGPMLPLEST